MTSDEFFNIWIEAAAEVADQYYPKGENPRRGEYLRDSGVLHVKMLTRLQDAGLIEQDLYPRHPPALRWRAGNPRVKSVRAESYRR